MNNGVVNQNNINPPVTTTMNNISNINTSNFTNANNLVSPNNIDVQVQKKEKKKRRKSIVPFLLLIIIGLGVYIYYIYNDYQRNINELNYNCSPIKETKEGKELDLNSTIVKDLYNKVYTSVKEDYAEPTFSDKLKLYLAYRQLTDLDKYESNCNMYDNKNMEPYTCNDKEKKPKAFLYESLLLKWKTLFGEETPMPKINVNLTNICVSGYQYIREREEYVEGTCNTPKPVTVRADKKLVKAISYNNTIILTEEVRYYAQENMKIPDYLKSGTYEYLFKLDMNYNYVLINKSYVQKY